MSVKNRLKARKLQIGNTLLVSLSICIAFMLIVILNLIPLIYEKLVATVIDNKFVNLTFSAIILFLVFCVFTAIKLGVCRFFYKRAAELSAGAKDIFYYFSFKKIFQALVFSVRLFCLKVVCFLFCFLPCILTLVLFLKLATNQLSLAIGIVLCVGAVAFAISAALFYNHLTASLFLSNYYFVSGCYLNFRHLIACSQNAMHRNKGELLKLKMSFLGWFFSCVFIFPLFYVVCYYKQSMAVLAFDFIEN